MEPMGSWVMGEVELGEAVCQVTGILGFLFKAWFTQTAFTLLLLLWVVGRDTILM